MLRFALCLLCVSAVQSARAADHALLSDPAAQSRCGSSVNTAQQVRRSPSTPQPELIDGDLWICSVGQKPVVNRQALDRAKEQGWGFWSFAAHDKCRAGIYLARASGGQLHDTGGDPWSDDPSENDPLVEFVRSPTVGSRPSAAPVRLATTREVYYTSPPRYYVASAPFSWGQEYGCSSGDCGASSGYASGWYGVAAGFGSGSSGSWSGGTNYAGAGSGGCVACGGN